MTANRKYRQRFRLRHESGITLIEVLVVVVIVSILAAVAFPSYMQFVVRAKRSAATSMLLQVADRQEQFFMDNKQYAATLPQLNFPAATFMIADEGAFVADGAADRIYQVSLTNTTPTTYTVNAVPQLNQAMKDTQCGSLSLTHTGVKGQSGGGENCW